MLNSHENLVIPKSERLRIGDWVVDIARREVGMHGTEVPRRITVKAMQVLLVLVAHHGKVVSREALLEWVWSDTLPSDDVLTQAVTQLRKAFGDEREAPRYLETIAKGGYRLLADVAWLPTQRAADLPMTVLEAQPALANHVAADNGQGAVLAEEQQRSLEPPALLPKQGGIRMALFAACSCLALLVVYVGVTWRGSRLQSPAQVASPLVSATANPAKTLSYSLIAAQPSLEIQPSLSPDGSLVAYSMSTGTEGVGNAIYVQVAEAVPPTKLTEPSKGYSDVLPRWSPNGHEIAFLRKNETTCDLLVIPASGGVPRSIGLCPNLPVPQYDWLPDGNGLLAGNISDGQQGARLSILDLRTGVWTPIRYEAARGDVDLDPHVSPDGRWVVFRRNISNSDFWRMPLAGGTPQRITRLGSNIYAWDWMPDGKSLVFSHLGEHMQLATLELSTGELRRLGVGDADVGWLDIAARLPAMTFTVVSGQTGIYRRQNPVRDAGGKAERLFPSSGSELMPSISPDGRHIAFYSDRTRSSRLWIAELGDPRSVHMVDGLLPVQRHPPRWLDDKTLLILASPIEETKSVAMVYSIDIASGRYARLEAPTGIIALAADPMPGGRLLMVHDEGVGKLSLNVMDTASKPWRVLATRKNVGEARYDAGSDSIWFVQADSPGLWRAGVGLGDERQIDPLIPAAYWMKLWLLIDGRPFTTRSTGRCAMSWGTIGASDESACLETNIQSGIGEPVLSMDEHWLYYSASTVAESSDIALARLSETE